MQKSHLIGLFAVALLATATPSLGQGHSGTMGGAMGGMGGMGGGYGHMGGMSHGMGSSDRGANGMNASSQRPTITPHSSTTLLSNTKLDNALTRSLAHRGVTVPAGGLTAACSGFQNLGQCVSALHVAKNLDLPGGFTALKSSMTSGDKLSLGAAIHQLKPDADAKAQERAAKRQANADLRAADLPE